jgi:hypothetical protein
VRPSLPSDALEPGALGFSRSGEIPPSGASFSARMGVAVAPAINRQHMDTPCTVKFRQTTGEISGTSVLFAPAQSFHGFGLSCFGTNVPQDIDFARRANQAQQLLYASGPHVQSSPKK